MCLIFGCGGSSLATCGISLDAVNGATFPCSAWTSPQIFSLAVGFLTTGLEVHHQQFFLSFPHPPSTWHCQTFENLYQLLSVKLYCLSLFTSEILHFSYLLWFSLYVSYLFIVFQFSSVTQSCSTLCNPMDCSMPDFPVHHQLLEHAQIHVC